MSEVENRDETFVANFLQSDERALPFLRQRLVVDGNKIRSAEELSKSSLKQGTGGVEEKGGISEKADLPS